MAVTRIKSNQITDLAVTNAKIANYAIQGGKLANSLTYGSDLTVSGNLTVSGTTTTVDSVTTTIDDPILLLASTQTGAASVDIGILGERGDDTNVFMGYDESADEFVMALTSTSDSNSAVTVTDYVTTHVGGLTVDDNATVGGTMTATGNITGGNITTAGAVTATGTVNAGGDMNATNINLTADAYMNNLRAYEGIDVGAFSGGNVKISNVGVLTSSGASSTFSGNVSVGGTLDVTGETTLASATVSDLTAGRVVYVSGSGELVDQANLTFNGSALGAPSFVASGQVTGATMTATGNIDGGNLTTAGAVTATGNITGGNLIASSYLYAADGNISGGFAVVGDTTLYANASVGGTLGVTGEATLASATVSDLTAGRMVYVTGSGELSDQANLTFNGSQLGAPSFVASGAVTGATMTATGNVTGGNLTTAGLVSATGNVTGGNLTTAGDVTTATVTASGAMTSATMTATGNVTGGNLITTGLTSTGDLTVLASGTIEMNQNIIGNVADPSSAQDVATKAYVDSVSSSGFTIADSANNQQTIAGGDTLTFAGTSNQINVEVSATDTVTISLPDDVTIAGNLSVQGTTTTVNSTVTQVADPIMQLGRGANNAALSSDDAKDRGISMYYYEGGEKVSFMGFDTTNNNFLFVADATITGEVVSGTAGNATFGTMTVSSLTDGTATLSSGALTGATSVTATGNVTGGNLVTAGDVTTATVTASGAMTSTSLTATGNVTGGNLLTGNVTISDNKVEAGNIQSSDDLGASRATIFTTLWVGGTATVGNVSTDGFVTANGTVTGGNLTTAGAVTATGNVTGGNLVTAGKFDNGSTNIEGGNISNGGTLRLQSNGGMGDTAVLVGNQELKIIHDGGNVDFELGGLTGSRTRYLQISKGTGNIAKLTTLSDGGIEVNTYVTATGNVTGGNLTTAGDVTTATVTASGAIQGANVTATDTLTGGNVKIWSDSIYVQSGTLVINDFGNDTDFRIEGDTNENLVYVDAGLEAIGFGGAPTNGNCTVCIESTNALKLPVGTTAQRPTGAAGMIRYNSSTDQVEGWDVSEGQFKALGVPAFTTIASETFDGDGSTTVFTLGSDQTTQSCIVSINGVVQLPTTAYAVSGNAMTFTEAPESGDKIEVRQITTTTTVASLSNGDQSVTIECADSQVEITGDVVVTGNLTFSGQNFLGQYNHSNVYVASSSDETNNTGSTLAITAATLGFDLTQASYYQVFLNRQLLRPAEITVNLTNGTITFASDTLAENDEIEAVFLAT